MSNFKIGHRVMISKTDIIGTITYIFPFNGFIEVLLDTNKLKIIPPAQLELKI